MRPENGHHELTAGPSLFDTDVLRWSRRDSPVQAMNIAQAERIRVVFARPADVRQAACCQQAGKERAQPAQPLFFVILRPHDARLGEMRDGDGFVIRPGDVQAAARSTVKHNPAPVRKSTASTPLA